MGHFSVVLRMNSQGYMRYLFLINMTQVKEMSSLCHRLVVVPRVSGSSLPVQPSCLPHQGGKVGSAGN